MRYAHFLSWIGYLALALCAIAFMESARAADAAPAVAPDAPVVGRTPAERLLKNEDFNKKVEDIAREAMKDPSKMKGRNQLERAYMLCSQHLSAETAPGDERSKSMWGPKATADFGACLEKNGMGSHLVDLRKTLRDQGLPDTVIFAPDPYYSVDRWYEDVEPVKTAAPAPVKPVAPVVAPVKRPVTPEAAAPAGPSTPDKPAAKEPTLWVPR